MKKNKRAATLRLAGNNLKLTLAAAIALVVGGLTTAGVWAAIPSSVEAEISACYKVKNGTLRIIDSEGGETCATNENMLTWPSRQGGSSGGPQTAYAYLNTDGTLDTTASKNIVNMKSFSTGSDPDDPNSLLYTFCFDLAFDNPKWSSNSFTFPDPLNVRGAPDKAARIDAECGSQYDALYADVIVNTSAGFGKLRFAFFE